MSVRVGPGVPLSILTCPPRTLNIDPVMNKTKTSKQLTKINTDVSSDQIDDLNELTELIQDRIYFSDITVTEEDHKIVVYCSSPEHVEAVKRALESALEQLENEDEDEEEINKNMKSKFDTIVEQILTPSQPAIKKVDRKITMYVYESGEIIGQEELSMRELKNRNIVTKVFEKYFGEGVVEEEDELEVQVTDGEIMIELNEEMFLNNTKFE